MSLRLFGLWRCVIFIFLTPGDFGIEDREILREEAAFEDTAFMHGSSASNLLMEADPGPAHLPEKSTNLDYDDFGDKNLENSDGGILGKDAVGNITDYKHSGMFVITKYFIFKHFKWISS